MVQLAEPYLGWKAVLDVPPGTWTVYSDRKLAPKAKWREVRTVPVSPGESPRQLWLSGSDCCVVSETQNVRWRPLHLFRLMRSLLRLQVYSSKGCVFLHAGMLAVNGSGVAFVGGKKSGKTSSILAMLLDPICQFVTNDDLTIVCGDKWSGLGWPRAAAVRPETLSALKILRPSLKDCVRDLKHPHNQGLDFKPEPGTEDETVCFYPSELAKAFGGTEVVPEAELSVLVFPEFTYDGKEQATISLLSSAEALDRLRGNLESNPARYEPFLSEHFEGAGAKELDDRLCALASRYSCYKLRQHISNLSDGARLARSVAVNP